MVGIIAGLHFSLSLKVIFSRIRNIFVTVKKFSSLLRLSISKLLCTFLQFLLFEMFIFKK